MKEGTKAKMIKTLAKSIREYKTSSILTPLFMVGEVFMECMIPFITTKLVDAIKNGGDMSEISRYGLMLVAIAVVSLFCGAMAGHFGAIASCGFAKNLRHDLYYSVQKYSFSNIDKFSSSSLVTRLTTDVNNVQMAYMMIIRTAVRSPMMLVFALIMVVTMSPKMSVAFAFIVPVLAIGLTLVITKAHPIFKSVFKKYDNLNNSIQENVAGMRVVKAYVRDEYENKKFGKASDEATAV